MCLSPALVCVCVCMLVCVQILKKPFPLYSMYCVHVCVSLQLWCVTRVCVSVSVCVCICVCVCVCPNKKKTLPKFPAIMVWIVYVSLSSSGVCVCVSCVSLSRAGGLGVSLFRLLSVRHPSSMVTLDDQYRMNRSRQHTVW